MEKKSRINLWALLAIILIGVPIGFVGLGMVRRVFNKPYLTLNKDTIVFNSEGGKDVFDIDSNTEWTIYVNKKQEWVKVTPDSGEKKQTVSLETTENTGQKDRSTDVRVTWGKKGKKEQEKVITIRQNGKTATTDTITPSPLYLDINPSNISFGVVGGVKKIILTSNTDWRIATANCDRWLKIGCMEGNGNKDISLQATENISQKGRSTTLQFSWKNEQGITCSKNVAVSQKGSSPPTALYLTVKPDNVTFDAKGGTGSVTIKSNTEWTAAMKEDVNWITYSSSEGNGNKDISLQLIENKSEKGRSTTLQFSWKNEQGITCSKNVNVSQKGTPPPTALYVAVKPEDVTFSADGGSAAIIVKSNTKWEVTKSDDEDWLTLGSSEGDGNKTITIKATKNTSLNNRAAKLSLIFQDEKGNNQSCSVNVSQKKTVPTPIMKSEAQAIVTNGKIDGKVPDDCIIAGNGVNTTYGQFRRDIVTGKYSSVQVQSLVSDKATGNASKINVKVTEAAKGMTNEEALSIISSGEKSNKVPETCTIIINGKSAKQYKKFRDGLEYGVYSNLSVTDVKCDAKGIATSITVNVTENGGDE